MFLKLNEGGVDLNIQTYGNKKGTKRWNYGSSHRYNHGSRTRTRCRWKAGSRPATGCYVVLTQLAMTFRLRRLFPKGNDTDDVYCFTKTVWEVDVWICRGYAISVPPKPLWHTAHGSSPAPGGKTLDGNLKTIASACNRFPARSELTCCYQRAQHIAFGISGVASAPFGEEKLQPDCGVPKLGMFNCCVRGSGWMCQSNSSRGTKPALLSPAHRLACQDYLLSFSLGQGRH